MSETEGAHAVADERRVHVLVEVRVDLECARVQAGLVGEGARADVRLAAVGRDVGDLADGVGDVHRPTEGVGPRASRPSLNWRLAATVMQVGVAGALAVAVDGALHVGGAGPHGGDGVGCRTAGVVVAVRPDPRAGRGEDVGDDLLDLVRQHAAVRVAEHDDLGPGLVGGADDGEGVVAVEAPAVEEVLAVDEDAAPVPDEVARPCHGPSRGSPRASCARPARRVRCATSRRGTPPDARESTSAWTRVLRRDPAGPTGGPEGGEGRVAQVELGPGALEELGVLRVRTGPPALDEVDPEIVEQPGDGELVGHREVEPLLLGAVAQGGVVDVQRFHDLHCP